MEPGQRMGIPLAMGQLAEQYHVGQPLALYNMHPRWLVKDRMKKESNEHATTSYVEQMGPGLQAEIERQLLSDFHHYVCNSNKALKIDWSEASPEGHDTLYFDRCLEGCSGLFIVDEADEVVAWGWMDFIYGGGDEPLFVFWHFLHPGHPNEENTADLVQSRWIPQHIWDRLPASTKDRCFGPEVYDARWCKDPLVLQWEEQRSQELRARG